MLFFEETAVVASEWSWQELAAAAGGVVSAVVVVCGLVKGIHDFRKLGWEPFRDKYIRPKKAWRKRQEEMFAKVEKVCEDRVGDRALLEEIHREVKPNGGASMNDRIVSMDDKVENLVARDRHRDETASDPTFYLDGTGQMTFANCAFRELLQAEDDQLLHHNYTALIERGDRISFIREREDAIRLKTPIDSTVHCKVNGPTFIPIRFKAQPDVRKNKEGEYVLKGFFGTACAVNAPVEIHDSQI
jgi:PAS domain-containing protein